MQVRLQAPLPEYRERRKPGPFRRFRPRRVSPHVLRLLPREARECLCLDKPLDPEHRQRLRKAVPVDRCVRRLVRILPVNLWRGRWYLRAPIWWRD